MDRLLRRAHRQRRICGLSVGWYIDEMAGMGVPLSPRARGVAEMVTIGEGMYPFTSGTFDAVCELLEHDVLLHTVYDTRAEKLQRLAEIVEEHDPR